MSSQSFDAMMDDIEARLDASLPAAAFNAMEYIHAKTTPKVPLETGNLVGSGAVSNTGPADAQIYYPGPYARYQEWGVSENGHELRHEHGQSFYLASTVLEEKDTAIAVAAQVIRAAIA
jgi:hypothetical protein